jgi:hypothetical protein
MLSMQGRQGVGERVGAREFAVAIGPDHEHAHGLFGRREMAQEQEAGVVGPLKIIEDQDDGLLLRHPSQQTDDGCEEEVALAVRVGRPRGREVRDSAGESRRQPRQFRSVFLNVGEQLGLVGVGDVMPDCFGK